MLRTARIYKPPTPEDGHRLLVMRFWPRGVRKDAVDSWEKALAPSAELLRGYRNGTVEWEDFARRYLDEVGEQQVALADLQRPAKRGTVTLLCGCRDASRCHRTLLKDLVEGPP